jgi:hypothetical protein
VRRNRSMHIRPLSVLMDILLNSLFVVMGVLIYYHFNIHMLAPFDLHPLVVSALGSKQIAVLIVSGLPFVIGVFGMITTLYRLIKRIMSRGSR